VTSLASGANRTILEATGFNWSNKDCNTIRKTKPLIKQLVQLSHISGEKAGPRRVKTLGSPCSGPGPSPAAVLHFFALGCGLLGARRDRKGRAIISFFSFWPPLRRCRDVANNMAMILAVWATRRTLPRGARDHPGGFGKTSRNNPNYRQTRGFDSGQALGRWPGSRGLTLNMHCPCSMPNEALIHSAGRGFMPVWASGNWRLTTRKLAQGQARHSGGPVRASK